MPTHDQDIFYNRSNGQILNYSELKSLYSSIAWPGNYLASGVDTRIADIGNPYVDPPFNLTDIVYWERLYRDPEPSVKLYQIAELEPVYQDTAGYYVQHWNVRARDSVEMEPVILNVSYELSAQKDTKLGLEVAFTNDSEQVFVADANQETINVINGLIGNLISNNIESNLWKGKRDPLNNNLPRWVAEASVSDLQGLLVLCVDSQQKAFSVENQVFQDYLVNFDQGNYDQLADVIDAYNYAYENS